MFNFKKQSLFTKFISLVVICLMMFAVTACDTEGGYTPDKTDDLFSSKKEVERTLNPEYTEVFTSNNIITADPVFRSENEDAVVMIDTDGTIENIEYGYDDNDAVCEMIDTIYFPIEEYTDEQIDAIDESMREEFADADALDCCTISYEITGGYYILSADCKDLDNIENLNSLCDLGLIEMEDTSAGMSFELSIEANVEQGFIRKYIISEE